MGERFLYTRNGSCLGVVLHDGAVCEPQAQPAWCRDGTWCTAQCPHARTPGWPFLTHPELLPGCMLGVLFEPSPRITDDFERLRGWLVDESTLSISVYVRVGHAEVAHKIPNPDATLFTGSVPGRTRRARPPRLAALGPRHTWSDELRYAYAATSLCALQLEKRWAPGFKRVVWFVASDHPAVRQALIDDFGEHIGNGSSPGADGHAEEPHSRRVVGSTSLGRHTRLGVAREHASPAEYESSVRSALADWWLLGEADFGVLAPPLNSQNSFGRSAFARGARTRSVFAPPSFSWAFSGFADDVPTERAGSIIRCGEEKTFVPMWSGR